MFKLVRAVMSGLACGLALGTMLYARATQNMTRSRSDQASHQYPQLQKLQHNIERLERELSNQKDKLVTLTRKENGFAIAIPAKISHPPTSELAVTTSITTTSAGVNRGSKEGFRLSDRLVFMRHTESGFVIDGLGDISQLYEKDLLAIKRADFCAIQPGDEVYIINRDNSRYSLANALLWCDSPK